MSQQITLNISDEMYLALQQQAEAVGLSISDWLMIILNKESSLEVLDLLDELDEYHCQKAYQQAVIETESEIASGNYATLDQYLANRENKNQ